jgi:hypothetical protein
MNEIRDKKIIFDRVYNEGGKDFIRPQKVSSTAYSSFLLYYLA